MAEQRNRLGAALLKMGGKTPADWTVEVFDSREWPDDPEAGAGLYRVRVGGKWVGKGRRGNVYYTADGLAVLLAQELTTPGALERGQHARPQLCKGQYVRWWPDDEDMRTRYGVGVKTKAASDPIQCIDGQWRIMVMGNLVCCNEVRGLDHFGRETQPETAKEQGDV